MSKLILPKCRQCGRAFVPTGIRQGFCRDRCRHDWHNEQRKQARAEAGKVAS